MKNEKWKWRGFWRESRREKIGEKKLFFSMSNDQEILDDLIFFSRSGDLEELKQVNARPELYITKNDVGNTALHMASANNHIGTIRCYP